MHTLNKWNFFNTSSLRIWTMVSCDEALLKGQVDTVCRDSGYMLGTNPL